MMISEGWQHKLIPTLISAGVAVIILAVGAQTSFNYYVIGQLESIGGDDIEMDRTQEVVLERLKNLEMKTDLMPVTVDDKDRIYKREYEISQRAIQHRLNQLEQFHEPYKQLRGR